MRPRVGRRGSQYAVTASAPVFDPATLSLSGWWRGSYSGSPWARTASAGGSGTAGRDLSEATNPPATGSAVNGYTPADCDGANDRLGNASDFRATFVSLTALTIVGLVYVDALSANGSGFSEEVVFGDSGGWMSLNLSTSGTRLYVWDTGEKNSPYTAVSTGAWHMVVGKFDAGFLYSKVDSGAWSAGTACGSAGIPAAQTVLVGRNVSGTNFLDGKIMEIMTATTALSDGDIANIKSYFNNRYALSL